MPTQGVNSSRQEGDSLLAADHGLPQLLLSRFHLAAERLERSSHGYTIMPNDTDAQTVGLSSKLVEELMREAKISPGEIVGYEAYRGYLDSTRVEIANKLLVRNGLDTQLYAAVTEDIVCSAHTLIETYSARTAVIRIRIGPPPEGEDRWHFDESRSGQFPRAVKCYNTNGPEFKQAGGLASDSSFIDSVNRAHVCATWLKRPNTFFSLLRPEITVDVHKLERAHTALVEARLRILLNAVNPLIEPLPLEQTAAGDLTLLNMHNSETARPAALHAGGHSLDWRLVAVFDLFA